MRLARAAREHIFCSGPRSTFRRHDHHSPARRPSHRSLTMRTSTLLRHAVIVALAGSAMSALAADPTPQPATATADAAQDTPSTQVAQAAPAQQVAQAQGAPAPSGGTQK